MIVVQHYILIFFIQFEFVDVHFIILQILSVNQIIFVVVVRLCLVSNDCYRLVPCFLISCMTILGFLLAPDSGEKLTLRKTNRRFEMTRRF